MNSHKIELLRARLADARSGKVVFVAHCILNENARYFGGAFCPGAIPAWLETLQAEGVGLIQMPCPERLAWGGVHKPLLWLALGVRGTWLYHCSAVLLPLFIAYTRLKYRRLARATAREMDDYLRSGYEIAGVLGVDGSPSCGVKTSIDITRAFAFLADLNPVSCTGKSLNDGLYHTCLTEGSGLYMAELNRLLRKRGEAIAWRAHSLVDEASGGATEPPRGFQNPVENCTSAATHP